jgi:hypothetical protein
VGEEFPLECPNCGGDIRLIAFRLLSECETIPGLRQAAELGEPPRRHEKNATAGEGQPFRVPVIWRRQTRHQPHQPPIGSEMPIDMVAEVPFAGLSLIDSVEVLPAPIEHYEQAHNLIVADFPTYFVGSRGMLVHENTPRAPTTNPQPGLVSR